MLENPWSAVGNPTSALDSLGSSFGPSSLAPVGIHHLLLHNLTTGCMRVYLGKYVDDAGYDERLGREQSRPWR